MTWLKQNKFPIIDTRCYKPSNSNLLKFVSDSKHNVFLKPDPSAASKNLMHVSKHTSNNELKQYVKTIADKDRKHIMVQKYVPSIGTNYPELRTFWVNKQYMYTIETEAYGWYEKLRTKELPPTIHRLSMKLLNALESKFGKNIVTRLDWAKAGNRFVLTEIEYAPGTFSDIFKKKDAYLDHKMGDLITKMARDAY